MNRRYTTEEFQESVNMIRKIYPKVSLTTDIIVGFPEETDDDFKQTYEFLKKIRFYKIHVFKYSPKKGTKAEEMKGQVEPTRKEERSKILIELSNENEIEYNKGLIGKEVEVLFEEKEKGLYRGHTANYIVVNVSSDKDISNQLKNVKITEIYNEIELLGVLN